MRLVSLTVFVLSLAALAGGCKKRAAPDSGEGKDADKDKLGNVAIQQDPAKPKGGPRKWGTFTVGKSTTVVTGPVEKDGHIDFAAALNERMSKGVTPENNANVAIWKVFGPTPLGTRVPAEFFDKLGVLPPVQGDYFIDLVKYARAGGANAVKAAFEAQKKYRGKPWTANEEPALSAWLRANEKPMAAITEAVKKTHYYNPLIPQSGPNGSKGLYSAQLPGVIACDEVGLAFACRAMLWLGHGNAASAWQDLLTCHRLARLLGRGGSLSELLVSVKLDQVASTTDVVFLDRAKLDAKSIETCLRDLLSLPPLPDVAEKIDLFERFAFLDTVMLTDRNGLAHLEGVAKDLKRWQPGYTDEALPGIDWNPAMESANKWYDRLVAALREPDRQARSKKLNDVDTDLVALERSINTDVLKDMSLPLAKRSAMIGDMTFAFLIPRTRERMDNRDRAQQQFDSTVVAFACVWYQRFNGKYPAKLADLAPRYLREVPKDLFNGKELVYKAFEQSFEILSVGENGIDEGGQSAPAPGFGDDIVIRFPPWVKP